MTAAGIGNLAQVRAGLHTRLQEHLSIAGHATLTRFAERYPSASLGRLAWLLRAGAVSPAEVATVLLEQASIIGRMKTCAYDLLVRSLNDLPRVTVSAEEARCITARVLVAWWAVVETVAPRGAPGGIVTALLADSEVSCWRRPLRFHSRMVRRVFDEHWGGGPVALAFEPLLATAEQA